MKKDSPYTIKDIAQELGLSPSTVSRALSGHPHISQETKDRVQEVVEKSGYRHNALASSLRNSKSNMIGLLVPRISMYFQSTVITAIQNKLHEFGYNLMVCQSNDSVEMEKELVNVLYSSRIEGLIVSPTLYTTDFSHFDIFNKSKIPLVFYDRVPKTHSAHKIVGDDYQGGYLSTKHLIEQGSRRIAHISGPLSCSIYRDRYAGFQEAMHEAGLEVEKSLVHFHELNRENALATCEKLYALGEFPNGVFACNDTTAIAVMEFAKKHGIAIPADVKIVGYSNDPRAEIIEPAITSIEQFPYEMGEQAADLMMSLILEKVNPGRNLISMTTPIELVIRKSSSLSLALTT
ncbi:LacI family DNA-binding transcriptional regulator [Rufibacter roseus]|uniref:LacI family DNA-binding transcriptional regulator n=1 Tax=Rufibacter roseus TaxID=1567108 RepID=A0ABW2DUS1_9BACT|nr:LacI family DNA-binding transcriptional regulator [Rufibacter roseus]